VHPELQNISGHIYNLGIGILSQAQRNAFYTDMGYEVRLDEGIFSVLQAAQAAELLIKAAISEQHPLLIFSSPPKSTSVDGDFLNLNDLFMSARTLQYFELPEKLWAVTGYKLENPTIYTEFGKLRNCIQHFATPSTNLSNASSNFIYKIIDPLLEHFWGEYAVEYVDLNEHESDFFELLSSRGITARYPEHLSEYAELAYK